MSVVRRIRNTKSTKGTKVQGLPLYPESIYDGTLSNIMSSSWIRTPQVEKVSTTIPLDEKQPPSIIEQGVPISVVYWTLSRVHFSSVRERKNLFGRSCKARAHVPTSPGEYYQEVFKFKTQGEVRGVERERKQVLRKREMEGKTINQYTTKNDSRKHQGVTVGVYNRGFVEDFLIFFREDIDGHPLYTCLFSVLEK